MNFHNKISEKLSENDLLNKKKINMNVSLIYKMVARAYEFCDTISN